MIGCNQETLAKHLQNQFEDGMTLENFGDCEVDHIRPVSSFNLETSEDMKKCFNYKNLQPLWMKDNRKKKEARLKTNFMSSVSKRDE